MKIVGMIGQNGSGKDTLVNYLHDKYGVPIYRAGDIARDVAAQEGIPRTRENLHDISKRYMQEHGRDFFVRELLSRIEEKARGRREVASITGIRTEADVELLRHCYGDEFILVCVKSEDPKVRYERLKERGEERDPPSYEEFLKQEKEEEELFDLSTTTQKADITIPNEGTLEEFHHAIEDELVRVILPSEHENPS
ncbi:MAG: AAA family ATPase [Candidatus Hydrogenedentota bacterium]